MSNHSPQEKLRNGIQGLHDSLDIKTYATTDGVRHKHDWRVVVTKDGTTVGDLCYVDRTWFKAKCTNKAQRDHRDDWVTTTLAGIKTRRSA